MRGISIDPGLDIAAASAQPWDAFMRIAHANGMMAAVGSLIWKPIPGTDAIATITIEGFRKDFNTRVTRCRGTVIRPGLVLGLDPDRHSVAQGMLMRVEPSAAASAWSAFRERELGYEAYVPTLVAAYRRDTAEAVLAASLLADTRSSADLSASPEETARVIRLASGTCGTNIDYATGSLGIDLANKTRHLYRPSAG
jgi:cation transport regulator ChaC